jgi:hypothetical protein
LGYDDFEKIQNGGDREDGVGVAFGGFSNSVIRFHLLVFDNIHYGGKNQDGGF